MTSGRALPLVCPVGLEYTIVRWPASSRSSVGMSGGDLVPVCESAEDLFRADPVLGEVDLRWPVGCQNLAVGLYLAFYALRSYFVDKAAEDGSARDRRPGEVCDRVVGPGRPELAAAVGRRPL